MAEAIAAPPAEDLRRTVVVVAAYREAGALPEVVADLARLGVRVVVVDDGSDDETAAVALASGATVLRHAVNRGQGAALQTGIEHALRAGAAFVVTFDADGQHRAEDVPRLLGPLTAGVADVALGSRFLASAEAVPRGRRLLLRVATWFTRISSGMRVTDAHNGLRAFTASAAAAIRLRQDRMAHASEILDQVRRARLRWTEVPVHVRYTRYSRAKGQGAAAAVRIAFDYILGRFLD